MEGNPDYDTLLRSIFDSCDTTGSGLISTTEFEDLCSQLSLENEYVLLYEYLFQSSTLLSYDRFREGLLQLLAGTLPPNDGGSECQQKIEQRDNDLNGNEVVESEKERRGATCESKFKAQSKADKSFGEHVEEPDWLVIDFHQTTDIKTKDDSRHSETGSRHSARKSYSAHKQRKYGRRTLPDTDLLSRNQHRHDMSSPRQHHCDRSETQGNDVDTLRSAPVTPSSRLVVEEFVGEGAGGDWTNPDLDVAPMDDTSSNDNNQENNTSSSADAKEALGAIWRQVIGDLHENIDVGQLQDLYQALSLTSSGGDVKQLFDILDSDGDGLISFADFARQMSSFLGGDEDEQLPARPDKQVENLNEDAFLHTTPHHKQNHTRCIQTPAAKDFADNPSVHSTPYGTDSLNTLPQKSTALDQHMVSSPARQSSTSGFVSTPPSATCFYSSSPSKTDYSSSTPSAGRLSLEGQTDDYDVRSYEGAPTYRRRRRTTNHATSRNRRRANKSVALPYYHPMSRRRLEDSPLYFLTGESGRYVDVENLHSIWKEEGIEDPDQVLKDLGVNLDDSFSVEILSEAMESEMKESMMHQAICCLYKSGIKFYRSKKEHETSERVKLESKVDYLNSQLREQDERLENVEREFHNRFDEMDKLHKEELAQLTTELTSEERKSDLKKDEQISRLRNRVDELQKIERVIRADLQNLMEEHECLKSQHQDTAQELHVSGVTMNQMRADFEGACHRMVTCSKSQLQQNDRLEALMFEYKKNAEMLRDENDELFNDIECMKKRWNSNDKVALAYTGRTFHKLPHLPPSPIEKQPSQLQGQGSSFSNHRPDSIPSLPNIYTSPPGSNSMPHTADRGTAEGEGKSDVWILSNDPDASMSDVSLTPKVLRSQSLYCELEATTPGLV